MLGTGTTFRATHSFVAILTNKPELQKRLQQEVDKAVGDETPRLADKDKMPYMEAVRFLLTVNIMTVSMYCQKCLQFSDTAIAIDTFALRIS